MDKQQFKKTYEIISASKKILLVTHYNPDADAIASALGMAEALAEIGKPFTLFCYNEPPRQFSFLPRSENFLFQISRDGNESAELPFDFSSHDLILVFDCGGLSRTKLDKEILHRKPGQIAIEIDHHPKMDDFAEIELRDPSAASTTEVLYNFFAANRIRFNKNSATCILAGIVTDTGNFLYPSTTDKTIKIASEMLVYGANLPRIVNLTLKNKSLSAMKLWGKIMTELRINQRYNLAIALLTKKEIAEFKVDDEDLEGISGFLSNLHGINGVVFLRETTDGKIKGSLRATRPGLDVSILARALGGGGHPKASGFMLEGRAIKDGDHWEIA
jgi:bifunctional oligoribonuclease and PAP phosphatase NrnA